MDLISASPGRCDICGARQATLIVVVAAALLFLDGQLGPYSFALRRATAATVAGIAALALCRQPGRPWVVAFGAAGAFSLVVYAPTLLLASLGFCLGLAFVGVGDRPDRRLVIPGLPQACLTYVGLSFLPDLIPQSRVLGEALSGLAAGYLQATTGSEHHLSSTAMGAPPVLMGAVYLLWRWRLEGSRLRLLAAVVLPVAWFLLLALAVVPAKEGPMAVFGRAGFYGGCWLLCATLIDAAAPVGTGATPDHSARVGRRTLVVACVASFLVSLTLVGVVVPWSPARRSILVHNRGGLDWDRPVFGRFGAFSGGMFGLLPVYARANGPQERGQEPIVTFDGLVGRIDASYDSAAKTPGKGSGADRDFRWPRWTNRRFI